MLNFLDKFLDNLAMWSIRGLVIIGVAFCVGFIWGVYDVAFGNDDIVGYTDHGIIIRESDLEKEDE
tara:strand:+ start:5438 stop:5635 length:198 start_codon:yes stop_codon:yes gene_type:complete